MGKRKDETAWHRLPEDWQPSAELIAWAKAKRPDMTLSQLEDEAENFREYWHNKRGKEGEKKDWDRAFQTWIRNARTRYTPGQPRPPYRPQYNRPDGGVVL